MSCTKLFRRVSGGTGGVVAGVLALAFVAVGSVGAYAAPPTVDGNIDDLLTYVASEADCGLTINDAAQDVCKTDAGIVPCVAQIACPLGGGGTYFVNGFDFTVCTAGYDAVGDDLYLGFRVVGQIGDANGDGDPGNVCAVPGANITDGAQISVQEQYVWELDTNCDGSPDILIEVRGDAVNVTGAAHGATSFAFNGTDLEVVVNDIQLPAIWRLRPFVGSTTDGLSEDTATPAECPPPNLDLEIEKTVNMGTVCPGGTVRFTVEVSNTGAAPLLVSLTDQLPAGLTYANNVSGDFTFQSEVAGFITFNNLTIPAGESRDVSFDATASLECFGEVTNVAYATGSYDEACLEDPIGVGPVQDDAVVVCQAEPCVDLEIDCPEAACEGESILLSANVTNCSDGPEDITVTIAGSDTTFQDVPSGGDRTWSRYVVHGPCVEGSVNYAFSAYGTSDCGSSEPVNDNCVVACEQPSIDVSITAPAEVVSGDEYCYTIVVENDGPTTLEEVEVCADICDYVTYNNNANPPADSEPSIGATGGEICWNIGTLAPGESRELSFCVIAVGNCPEIVTCTTPVHARGVCAEAEAEADDQADTRILCPGENCPRTPGYWTQQCKAVPGVAPKGNVKYWYSEVVEIAECVDAESEWFDWDNAFDGFCSTVNPERPMNPYKQLQRHYAVLLANYCTGQLGTVASNGAELGLDLNTGIDCIDGIDTIQELIDAIEEALAEGDDGLYTTLLGCADEINNGIGIPVDPDCGDHTSNPAREPELDLSSFRLERPAPNPFQGRTTVRYTVSDADPSGVQVRLGIYNVAGRLVKTLVSETQGPGQYQVNWDGTDDGGAKVNRGVYFVRGLANGQNIGAPARVVFLR